MTEFRITAANLRIIMGNRILAVVDLRVDNWAVSFRGCRWLYADGRERVQLGCDDSCQLLNEEARLSFQRAALAAVRQLAERALAEVSAQ